MNWANRLTLSRLILTILFVVALNSPWEYGRTAALALFLVAGVTDFGLFCELKDVYVEGLIPKEKLGEEVELDDEHHRLRVGKSGRSYGVGDELRVRLIEADPVRRRIALEPASLPRSGSWLTEDDVEGQPRSPKQKPRRPGPPGQRPGSRRPPRGPPPGRRSRRTRTPASGR